MLLPIGLKRDFIGGVGLALCLRAALGEEGGLLLLIEPCGDIGGLSLPLTRGDGALEPNGFLWGVGDFPLKEAIGDGALLDGCGEEGGLNFLLWIGENCLCALLLYEGGPNILDCLGENLGLISSYISDLWRGIGLLRVEKLLCLKESCGEGRWLNCLIVIGWIFSCGKSNL